MKGVFGTRGIPVSGFRGVPALRALSGFRAFGFFRFERFLVARRMMKSVEHEWSYSSRSFQVA